MEGACDLGKQAQKSRRGTEVDLEVCRRRELRGWGRGSFPWAEHNVWSRGMVALGLWYYFSFHNPGRDSANSRLKLR